MLVSADMPWVFKCLRCMLEIWSGPVDGEFLSFLIVWLVSSVWKAGGKLVSIFVRRFLRPVVLFCLVVGLWLILA